MSETEIDLTDETDRWRWTCPNGHRSWEPTNHHFFCVSCGRHVPDSDGTFEELRNRSTGERVARDDARLVTQAGPYDGDLDRRGSA